MNPDMLEHLQMLLATVAVSPLFWAILFAVWLLGRVLGSFMPWHNVVKPMVILYVIGLALKFTLFPMGYDLYFLFGMPFIAGLWTGSRKHQA